MVEQGFHKTKVGGSIPPVGTKMNKILLNGKELSLTESILPMLVHGEDKSGSSLYTISLAANFYSQGSKLLFLCGYTQAPEEFTKQVGSFDNSVSFFVKERAEDFKKKLSKTNDEIVIIKNIELLTEDIFNLVTGVQKLIISGDISRCSFKKKILEEPFATKVYFSGLESSDIPKLEKYSGFLNSKNLQGITRLQIN